MRWSLPLFSLGGTVIRIHVTFLLFLVWLWGIYYRQGGAEVAWQGTTFIVLIFLCVLLHELGVDDGGDARRKGVQHQLGREILGDGDLRLAVDHLDEIVDVLGNRREVARRGNIERRGFLAEPRRVGSRAP